MSGTVNISRSIWSDTAFKEQPFTEREAFMWMVMEASWKAREKRVGSVVVSLDRGQLASSIRFMAEAWGWQKSTVDRFLKRLENRDMIGTASGTGVNVITIRKYNDYQNAPKDSGTPSKQKAGQQRDSSGTNENKGLIPDEIHTTAASASEVGGLSFSEFWMSCPHKTNKVAAEAAWKKLGPDARRLAFENVKPFYAWFAKTYPTASPLHPSTYLNKRRWEDEGWKPAAMTPQADKAAFWAESINAGKYVSPATCPPAVCREMISRGLVTERQVAERGLVA